VFWLNRNGTISSVSKVKNRNESPIEYRTSEIHLPQEKVSQILSVGSSLQPYPGKEIVSVCSNRNCKTIFLDAECMVVGDELASQLVPALAQSTSDSITLKMPKIEMNQDEPCGVVSLPTPHFHIYHSFKSCSDDEPAACSLSTLDDCKYNVSN
jgi:hypothetical protein